MSMTDTQAAGTETTAVPAGTETTDHSTTQPEGGAPAKPVVETFDRPYVEDLRKENAGYRTKLREFEDTFAGYRPEHQDELRQLIKGLADPATQRETAARWKEISEKILEAETAVSPTTGEPDPGDAPLTIKQWEALQAKRDEAAMRDQAIKEIEREADGMGFKPGSMEYSMLLFQAQVPGVDGDLAKAAEGVKAYNKKVIDDYAKSVAEGADKWPAAAGTAAAGGAAEQSQVRPNYKDARRAAMEYAAAHAGDA